MSWDASSRKSVNDHKRSALSENLRKCRKMRKAAPLAYLSADFIPRLTWESTLYPPSAAAKLCEIAYNSGKWNKQPMKRNPMTRFIYLGLACLLSATVLTGPVQA
ncbi:MAG TPA: hypothetical protein V6D23_03550, partial [Candidatus Obscuribacterales bacterium]